MRIIIKTGHGEFSEESRVTIEEKLSPLGKLLGNDEERALLEVEIERAPAEGRSSEPYRMSANIKLDSHTYHAEAVKPTVESVSDRVREELSNEIRHAKGKSKSLWKRGGAALKSMLRGATE